MDTSLHATISRPQGLKEGETRIAGSNPAGERFNQQGDKNMRIYSGSSCFCDTGIPTGEVDMHGNELFSGDIVQLWHGRGCDK